VTKAFTLVEILIVVIVLGILAAIVLPQFSDASAVARASMLADDLRVVRTQVEVFKAQHSGVSPGYPNCDRNQTPTEQAFVDYMTGASDSAGNLNPPGRSYGPYLREMPPNPVNGKNSVLVLHDGAALPDAADDSHGWIFQPSTLVLKAGCTGVDDKGKSYFDY
jgi:general secretion pathway protein G